MVMHAHGLGNRIYENVTWMKRLVVLARPLTLGVVFVVLYLVAVRTQTGQQVDSAALGIGSLLSGRARFVCGVLRGTLVSPLAVAAVVLAAAKMIKRQWRELIAAVIVVGASLPVTEILKHGLSRPDFGVYGDYDNTFPSGHTAALGSLIVAIYLLAPRSARGRILAVSCAIATAVTGTLSVVTFAHRPSDVLAGLLLVAFFGSIALRVTGIDVMPHWSRWEASILAVAAVMSVISWTLVADSSPRLRAATIAYGIAVMVIALATFGGRDTGSSAGDPGAGLQRDRISSRSRRVATGR